jgi:hypothetical protein
MKDKGRGAEALRLFDFCRRSCCDVHYRPKAAVRACENGHSAALNEDGGGIGT